VFCAPAFPVSWTLVADLGGDVALRDGRARHVTAGLV
jgi:hypothetical protein